MEETKASRKRVANFTADEKVLLAKLVKKNPIIESKKTDAKSVQKKKLAWFALTDEFNSNEHVHKRATISLRKAWENLKSRKRKSAERGNFIKSGGRLSNPPQQKSIISTVEEVAPVLCEIKNSFDNDGSALLSEENKETQEIKIIEDKIFRTSIGSSLKTQSLSQTVLKRISRTFFEMEDIMTLKPINKIVPACEANDTVEFCPSSTSKSTDLEWAEQRKPLDYIRREAVLRIKHFEAKKKYEIQILKAKLENEVIKKRAAKMEEERNQYLLEMSKLELAELKKRLGK